MRARIPHQDVQRDSHGTPGTCKRRGVFRECWGSRCRRNSSTPSRIRTCDLRIRSPLLYPAELWAQNSIFYGVIDVFPGIGDSGGYTH